MELHKGLANFLFDPTHDEAWKTFAREIGGQFVPGDWKRSPRVETLVGKVEVTLDCYTIRDSRSTATYTRLRAPYRNPSGFRFKVFQENGWKWWRERFGAPDVTLDLPGFDDDYVVQGNQPEQLRRLFASQALRDALTAEPTFWLQVRDNDGWFSPRFPQGVDQLFFQANGHVSDPARLRRFYTIFTEALLQLYRIDGAEDAPAGVDL